MNRFLSKMFGPALHTGRGLRTGDIDNLQWSSWTDVHKKGRKVAGELQRQGIGPKSRVAVLAINPGDVAAVIQGIWMSAATVTMLQQPTTQTDLGDWQANCLRAMAMLHCDALLVGGPFLAAADSFRDCGITVIEITDHWDGAEGQILHPGEDDVAIYQLTSGSTGDPKAVAISYRNLYANGIAMEQGSLGGPDNDVMVSWLPLSHDMGLIGFLLTPMAYGIETVCVAPTEFLKSPLNWLQLISDYRGTMTAAPNFAYSIVRRRLAHVHDGQFDLSSLRFALCGAEPIDAETMRNFSSAASRFGFDERAIVAAYGMAEATLAVSFATLGEGLTVDKLANDEFRAAGTASTNDEPGPPKEVALLGRPLPGMQVRVVDAHQNDLPERMLGEFLIRGDAVTRSYATSQGEISAVDEDGWLHTGDLGYRTEAGEIAICARLKNIIIVAGRNIFPADIEKLAESVHGVRPGGVIAFGITNHNAPEQIRIVAEVTNPDSLHDKDIRRSIAKKVFFSTGISPSVILQPKGSIPKTPSGKLSHVQAKRIFSEVAA